ncbi:pickpocket protein 28-like [Culicoides brevitarsis]|uniref:pickpocket protein 28-like n=1 Tax=Culicoides brevitarsis TaxID=469753 RepID=UPI00307CBBA9
MTVDGVCYSMNLISPEEMFIEKDHVQYNAKGVQMKGWKNGFESYVDKETYPARELSNEGMKIRLRMNLKDLPNSKENFLNLIYGLHGFYIIVGNPQDYPRSKENRVFIPTNSRYTLKVTPEMISADETLKKYPLKKRGCLIQDSELNRLKIFKRYSLSNCFLECSAKFSIKRCNCYQFFMPGYTNETCGSDPYHNSFCYESAANAEIERSMIEVQNQNFSNYCNCTPACSSLAYTVFPTFLGTFNISDETFQFSDVTIRFASSEFIPKIRRESSSDLDMLAAIGGALGFFIGASVISIIEFVYYFSIKILVEIVFGKDNR